MGHLDRNLQYLWDCASSSILYQSLSISDTRRRSAIQQFVFLWLLHGNWVESAHIWQALGYEALPQWKTGNYWLGAHVSVTVPFIDKPSHLHLLLTFHFSIQRSFFYCFAVQKLRICDKLYNYHLCPPYPVYRRLFPSRRMVSPDDWYRPWPLRFLSRLGIRCVPANYVHAASAISGTVPAATTSRFSWVDSWARNWRLRNIPVSQQPEGQRTENRGSMERLGRDQVFLHNSGRADTSDNSFVLGFVISLPLCVQNVM